MKVDSTWSYETPPRLDERSVPEPQASFELRLQPSPWSVRRPSASDDSGNAPACELTLDLSAAPLRCEELALEAVTSARHIEVYVKGIRRNLLGEEELNEVYFGTFRGSKATECGTPTHLFEVSERFRQRTNDHDVLKCVHHIRLKFLSLTGDKSLLNIAQLACQKTSTAVEVSTDPPVAPKAVEAVVKLVDDDEALHKVQTQVKSLAEHGHVVTELDEACGEEVAYRMQGNLELYTEENLRKRLQLQQNPHLVALTQRLWLSAMQDNEEQMSYDEYEAFMLRLHRLILPEFDFDQSKDLIKDDWARDTDGSEYLDYRFFHWSMFELVDITPVDILDESKKIQLVDIQRDLHRELTSESATLYLERPTPDKA
ncbi:hypothetical protein ATCC90586_009813 [Pythium insidiosum]|nr:hypothetical protein ATCC90586_009813 [Pythium insidiosum]